MEKITIYPEGRINFGVGHGADGECFIQIALYDGAGAVDVTLDFELAAFVAFADHLRMVADQVIAEHGPSTGET